MVCFRVAGAVRPGSACRGEPRAGPARYAASVAARLSPPALAPPCPRAASGRGRGGNSLLEDVGDAIHDLAEGDDGPAAPTTDTMPMATATGIVDDRSSRASLRRTAKRTPRLQS